MKSVRQLVSGSLPLGLFVAAVAVFASLGSEARNHQDAPVMSLDPVTTSSGLVYLELVPGTGISPTVDDVVRAHYHGTLADGTVFDSSVERGQPLELPLRRVIPCWQEGIPMMREGGKSRLTCPPGIAYGNRAVGAIPAGSTLTFEVELIKVLR